MLFPFRFKSGHGLFLASCFVINVMSCSVAPTKHISSEPKLHQDSADLYRQGSELYKQWSDSNDEPLGTLFKAGKLLTRAWKLQPQNVLYQSDFYNAFVNVVAVSPNYQEQTLLTVFNVLHPLVQQELVSPAFVSYSLADKQKMTVQQRMNFLLRAIEQNPRNPQNWFLLSQLYTADSNFSMAATTAKQAPQILPENPLYEYQFGTTLGFSAEQSACTYQHKSALKSAVTHLAKAVAVEPENPKYLTALSRQYLHLGIVPLAFVQAKKAFEIKKNKETATNYYFSSLYSNRPEEMRIALGYLWEHHRKSSGMEIALSAWRMGVEQSTVAFLDADKSEKTLFHSLNLDYLSGLNGRDFEQTLRELSIETRLIDYVLGRDVVSDEYLIISAKNPCQVSEFMFYAAINRWRNGDEDGFKAMLTKIKKQKTPLTIAGLWAQNILSKMEGE